MKIRLNKLLETLEKKLYIILPIITLFCLAGFIGSLVFPNEVLDTNTANMEESEEDIYLPLQKEGKSIKIGYEMTTESRPLKGVQVGIDKNGQPLKGTVLNYHVYVKEEDKKEYTLVSENIYDLGSQTYDFQYVYLPFSNFEKCQGQVYISFFLNEEKTMENPPALRANDNRLEHTTTCYEEESGSWTVMEGGLMLSYIYSHDTYPFLYEFRILTFVFLAASMTLSYEKAGKKRPWQKKGGMSYEK